jgi:cyclic pyranopterin phosphate synthase
MTDSHGRTIRDLRISITDRCNFRCVYCMEPTSASRRGNAAPPWMRSSALPAIAESLGVRKIRLTGGEPTLHPELADIIAGIRAATTSRSR